LLQCQSQTPNLASFTTWFDSTRLLAHGLLLPILGSHINIYKKTKY